MTARIDLATADWPPTEPIAAQRVLSGSPAATTIVLSSDGVHESGLWRVSPGSFSTDHAGYVECITVLAGRAELVGEDGVVTELHAGVSVSVASGWRGSWVVHEELTKSYVTIQDR